MYTAQSARDAQRIGYNVSYCDYLQAHAEELAERFPDRAGEFYSRSLSEALAGNNGD